ncbi:MAG: alkaline phosphatase family protein [Desulfocapsa sp.]|nr:alkaline phosphatase family protein [Desulfocapsa sp.]
MNKAKKLLVLGVDAALPDLIRKFSNEGALPNISKLMGDGFFSRVISTFPPLTAAAWGALVTGAGPGTCGIPSLMVRLPGEELDDWHTSFDKRFLLAETLWESEGQVGRKSALVNWPVTWPVANNDGIQIASSLNPPFRYFYMPLWDIAGSSVYSSAKLRCNQTQGRAVKTKLQPAAGWKNLPQQSPPPLEFALEVPPALAKGVNYNAVFTGDNDEYNTVHICRGKDISKTVAKLKQGQWSDWIFEKFIDVKGNERNGRFRIYLPELSKDAKNFKVFTSSINTLDNYCVPADIQTDLEKVAGPYVEVDDPWAYMDGWVELDDYMVQLQQLVDWWTEATRFALKSDGIDSTYSWIGTVDHLQHVIYGGIDPKSSHYDPDKANYWMDYLRRSYQQIDQGIGKILEDVDLEETLIVVVSDHGFSTLESSPYLKKFLHDVGLIAYDIDKNGTMNIDWSKTKCFPLEPCHAHIFVNLKGRDPQGIVEPEDYEKVQEEIIDKLMSWIDPETGERVVDLAIPKRLAGQLGVFEFDGFDRVGDVLFAVNRGIWIVHLYISPQSNIPMVVNELSPIQRCLNRLSCPKISQEFMLPCPMNLRCMLQLFLVDQVYKLGLTNYLSI